MKNPDHISKSLETIFRVKILNSLMRIRNPGSRVEKIWIRDPEWKNFEPVKLALVRKYCNGQLRIQAASPAPSVAPPTLY